MSNSGQVRGFENASGALWGTYANGIPHATGNGTYSLIKFLAIAASRSSVIYGNSSTVTPLSLSCKIVLKY